MVKGRDIPLPRFLLCIICTALTHKSQGNFLSFYVGFHTF